MEFYKDLNIKDKKSKPQRIIGIFLLFLSALWILNIIYHHESIRVIDLIYSFILLLQGIVHIIEGSGTSIHSYFGEAYIDINSEQIRIKVKVLKPELNIVWNEIKNINFRTTEFEFYKTDNSVLKVKYNIFGYHNTKVVKEVISAKAQEKGIEIQTL